MTRTKRILAVILALVFTALAPPQIALSQGTALGEIENRPAPVARRMCIGGSNAGSLCKQNSDCPGSTCFDRNVFNISVSVQYDASNADLTAIEDLVSAGSAMLFDITDGQAEIGQATIHNNAFGTTEADLRITPQTCTSGPSTGNICTSDADCAGGATCGNSVWWFANTGSWKTGGAMNVSIDNVLSSSRPGEFLAHEFTHLVFDARDEYEARPGCGGSTSGDACPIPDSVTAGEEPSIMDGNGTEFCWGQGDASDATDISGGNHDADNTTEQSQCRANRSVWDQVIWSWPSTFLKPAAAPDPEANGATVNQTQFIHVDEERRVVLVLDESGSMTLESPSRMERLNVAAKDFIALAENGTEVGIVSYSNDAEASSGRANVPISALGADRSAWNDAIDDLSPGNYTNIGAGLQKARDMIAGAGGVTGNTYVVLMTDGLNNRPEPQATADATLQAAIDDLLADGVPVYVTCTGSDLGLKSQCAEIASGTGGHYVDSTDAASLPKIFTQFHERSAGYQKIGTATGQLGKAQTETFWLEPGAEAVSFTFNLDLAGAGARITAISPDGQVFRDAAMPQGRFIRVKEPAPGEWAVRIQPFDDVFLDSAYVLKAYSFNRVIRFDAGVSQPVVRPGEAIRISAFPFSLEGAVTHPKQSFRAQVTRPDGVIEVMELHDRGRNAAGIGDDVPQDGIFTGLYTNTQLKGAYTFEIRADIDGWRTPLDSLVDFRPLEEIGEPAASPRFVREFTVTAAVGDHGDVEPDPEDGPGGGGPGSANSVASYLIGTYDLREGRTFVHVMNPTGEPLAVLVALFTEDGKPQRCVRRKLAPNGLFELDVERLDLNGLLGVVKVLALDPETNQPKLGVVGNQRTRFEGRAVSETSLHPVSDAILRGDIKRILAAC